MNWTTINFGKHKGKTLPQVILDDPDWFFWAYENKIFKGALAFEAQEVYRRARSIRVPQRNGQRMLVEYIIDKPTGKFGKMRLIPDGTDLGTPQCLSGDRFLSRPEPTPATTRPGTRTSFWLLRPSCLETSPIE